MTGPESADEHIASTIAAVREGGRHWAALVDARRSVAAAADRRTCLLISLLCGVVLLGAVTACALTVGPALGGTNVLVPVVVALFGVSGAMPAYLIATVLAGRSPGRIGIAGAIMRSGQALLAGAAVAAVAAGVLVGMPPAGIVVGVLVAVLAFLGRPVIDLFARMAASGLSICDGEMFDLRRKFPC